MKSNFEFLRRYWPALAEIGATAEGYLFTDPNSCIFKLGMFGERVVSEIFAVEHLRTPEADDSQAGRIRILKREGLLPSNIDDIFYTLRQQRNKAVHAGLDSLADAKTLLEMTYRLACWFMEVYGDWGYIPDPFIMPEKEVAVDYASLLAEKEAEIVKLNARVTAVVTAASAAPKQERKQKSEQVAASSDATEAETRLIIDCQLRAAGWEADTQSLRYANGTRPVKGRNLAIAEWPTTAQDGDDGRADYALFIGLQMVGIIEAKRISIDVPGVVDGQCREYAAAIREEDKPLCIGEWGGYYVPFLFAANGRRYVEQWKEKSGVWFRDVRNPANKSRALRGWMSPEGLTTLLSNNPATANAKLENTPYDLLRDPDGLHLRDYQIRAIEAAEKAIINGQKAVLLSMSTGTGKTRTVLGMIYRFLSTNRFRRILFLVDRNSLGEQAQDVFKEVKLEELLTLDNIYNIRELGQQGFDAETRIKVATVQSMVRHLLNDEEASISVSDYDLIIVDEAHRGYTMDKELSETEMLYRDEADYISKYRMVIEYFDAVKIALTATPALHTTAIFGNPVFNYSYREAVIDGYLVDHDAPHNIVSKLRAEGIRYSAGEQITMIDPVTGELLNSSELKDEIEFDVETFNRQVIAYETGKTFRSKPKHRQISDEEIFRHQVEYCYQALADYRNQLVQWQKLYEPQSPSDDFDSRFMEALMNLDFVEYQLDVLLFGKDFEKEQLVTDFLKNEHRYEEVSGMKPIVNTPVYHQSAAYAREHGELDQFRQSHQANIACKKDIEEAIFQNFDGFRLNKHAISGVLEKYGPERVGQVLAATVQVKAWDGRFSSANKDWDFTYDFPETHDMLGMDRRDDYAVTSHPAVLDGFINTARKEIAALEHPTYDTVEHTGNEKQYAVLLTDEQEVKILECDPQEEMFSIARATLGCDWIELVEPESLSKDSCLMLIDEEGKLHDDVKYINCIASDLYGSERHGDPIVGGAMIVKAGDDRLELLTDKEAAALAAGLDQKRELAINKISRAFGLHPAGKDEIEKALSDRRQPCRKSGMER